MSGKRARFANYLSAARDPTRRAQILDEILAGRHTVSPAAPMSETVPAYTAQPGETVTPTVCFSCHSTCEALVYSESKTGEVLRVEGDPTSPQTRGILCAKGLAARDLLYNPTRLKMPLRRVGARGEGKFEEISWDEALEITADKLLEFRDRYGPQSLALLEGTRRGWSRVYSRFCNLFGAPNHGAAGWAQCLWPRLVDCNLTFGGAQYMETFDFPNTHCILAWGVNPPTSWGVRAADIMDARMRGAALLVIDPQLSETAAKADLWLQPRPGTDMALALAMIQVIISENLTDVPFVREWTVGFERVAEQTRAYTPAWAEKITGVPAEKIALAARVYARAKSACLIRGLALDQMHDSVQVCRATSILASITGNIGRPGGNILVSSRGEVSQNTHRFICSDELPEQVRRLRIGYDEFPLLCGELSPVPSAHMPSLWRAMATGKPYPIRCAMIFGSNAAVSYTNSDMVQKALETLDFLVVSDLFLTPTGRMADIVLPASAWLERDNVISSFQSNNTHTLIQQKAASVGQARSDVDIICELARRVGLGDRFWKDARALYDDLLAPAGVTFQEAAKRRRLYAPLRYETYREKGFQTPSGKIELYSSLAKQNGCDPAPRYTPPFESGRPSEQYPLLMSTGRHESAFRISENRQNPYLLELAPRAYLYINPATAEQLPRHLARPLGALHRPLRHRLSDGHRRRAEIVFQRRISRNDIGRFPAILNDPVNKAARFRKLPQHVDRDKRIDRGIQCAPAFLRMTGVRVFAKEFKFQRHQRIGSAAQPVFRAGVDHHRSVEIVEAALLGHPHLAAEVFLSRRPDHPDFPAQLIDHRFISAARQHADRRDQIVAAPVADLRQRVVFA